MPSPLSKASQETAVGEGLALGCVAAGVEAVAGSKMAIEFAFVRAWRRWSHASSFPTVKAGVERNDLLRILHRSPRRRSSHLTGWASEWPFVPYIAENWTVEEIGELLESSTGVPLHAWQELARRLVEDLTSKSAAPADT